MQKRLEIMILNFSLNSYSGKKNNVKTVQLKELLRNKKVIIGFTPPRDDDSYWFGGKNIWVKITDLTDDMYISSSEEKITDLGIKPRKQLPIGTLLFSFKLSIGKVAITTQPLYTNEAIAGLIVDDEIIKKYLYYILPKLDYNSNRATKGNTLNSESVGDLEIPFEDSKVKKVVTELDALEEKRQNVISLKTKYEKQTNSYILENVFS